MEPVTTVDGYAHTVTAHIGDALAKLYLNARSEDRSMVYQALPISSATTPTPTDEKGSGVEVARLQGPTRARGRAAPAGWGVKERSPSGSLDVRCQMSDVRKPTHPRRGDVRSEM